MPRVVGTLPRDSDGLDAYAGDVVPIVLTLDGGGVAITTGLAAEMPDLPFACTIQRWTIVADQSGSVVVDFLRATYANYPTMTSIAGTEKPTLSSSQKNQDTNLTTWTTSLAQGDILRASVESATTVQRVVVTLWVKRT